MLMSLARQGEAMRTMSALDEIRFDYEGRGVKVDADGWEHRAYTVAFFYEGRSAAFPYRMGMGLEGVPERDEVLHSLFLDAGAEGVDFEEWAGEYGYDTDSRKAEATWRACVEVGQQLRNLLRGDYEQVREEIEALEL